MDKNDINYVVANWDYLSPDWQRLLKSIGLYPEKKSAAESFNIRSNATIKEGDLNGKAVLDRQESQD